MTFRDQGWNQRFDTLGDTAEGIYEAVAPLGATVRYGLNRPPFKMKHLTPMQRNSPDYLTGTGDFVEVMGCGRDNTVKMKLEKWEAQKKWNKVGPLRFFFWNSSHNEWALLTIDQTRKLVAKAKRVGGVQEFTDGNEYVGIDWSWIESVFPYVAS